MAIGPPFGPEIEAVNPQLNVWLREYRQAVWDVCEASRQIECGPDLHAAMLGQVEAYVGTDQIHPNEIGAAIMAEAWAAWFQSTSASRSR
jgi:lysophospholipase L1-like esterase